MYGDPSSPVSPGFDWATFFTWRNPLAFFGGVALVPSMVLLSVAILVRAAGCHQPRAPRAGSHPRRGAAR